MENEDVGIFIKLHDSRPITEIRDFSESRYDLLLAFRVNKKNSKK